jgi:hypothetical protein
LKNQKKQAYFVTEINRSKICLFIILKVAQALLEMFERQPSPKIWVRMEHLLTQLKLLQPNLPLSAVFIVSFQQLAEQAILATETLCFQIQVTLPLVLTLIVRQRRQ